MKGLLIVKFFFNDCKEFLYKVKKSVNSSLQSYVEPSFSYIYLKTKNKNFNTQKLQKQAGLHTSNYSHVEEEIVAQESTTQ